MPYFPNFHVTVNGNINDVDEANSEFDHYCLLFAGKLSYFGTETWEQYALTHYKRFFQQCKNKNIKITCKFIVYESDEVLSGHMCNRLSGFGNLYPDLFTTIKNTDDITQIYYPHQYDTVKTFDPDDIEKYKNIVSWLGNNLDIDNKLKKGYFEEYCKDVFGIVDNIHFYYVDSNKEVLTRIQTILKNPDIKSVYGFGQHFQVGAAYSNYPNMFDDIDTNALVIKVRYDCVYFNALEYFDFKHATEISPELLKNVFYSVDNEAVFRHFFCVGRALQPDKFSIYQLPTVMYTRQRSDLKLLIHSFPHDISLIFNKAGIVYYATHYTDYILNQAVQTHDVTDKEANNTGYFLGLNIHSSLGKFFKNSNFNQLEYTPLGVKPGHSYSVNVFGAILRDMILPNGSVVGDSNGDYYKLKWYTKYDDMLSKILERFGQ